MSALDVDLKKLYVDIQNKLRQIDLEKKQIETLKKKQDVSYKIVLINVLPCPVCLIITLFFRIVVI